MKAKIKFQRLTALLLCMLWIIGLLAPAAYAQGDTIYIWNRGDWEQLTRNCRLDTWSQGKTVVLECDLDLIGEAVIPTFGGTFQGNGHSIRGLKLSKEGDHQGLFRYVQEGGVIEDLTVTGVISPDGSCSAVGGIAGVNYGTITQCQYEGDVTAANQVGGIAGINEASGTILNCSVTGNITGEHYTGGIVGENYGSVIQSVNRAKVNTRQTNVSPNLDGLDWRNLNSTENMPACTDTGGIAGYSKGILQSCTNYGSVGYPHTGYNVGGIVGRQSGYVDGCVNQGTVLGRKEVGGIAGQMEPYTLLKFEEDTLHALLDELSVLNELLNGTVDSADVSRQQLSEHLTAVADLTSSAREDASSMLDDVADLGEGTIDTVNDLSARVSRVLDQSVPMVEDLQEFSDQLGKAIRKLEDGIEILESAGDDGTGALRELRRALTALESASDQMTAALDRIHSAFENLKSALGRDEAMQAALEELGQAASDLTDALKETALAVGQLIEALGGLENLPNWKDADRDALEAELNGISSCLEQMTRSAQKLRDALFAAAKQLAASGSADWEVLLQTLKALASGLKEIGDSGSGIGSGLGHIKNILPYLEDVQDTVLDASKKVRTALDELSDSTDAMSSAMDRLGDILQEQADEPKLELPKLDSSFYEKEERLDATLDAMADRFEAMRQTAQQAGDDLSGNFRGITDQVQVILDLLRDAQESNEEDTEYVVDVSEENVASITLGKVSGCTNQGSVEGDVNIGGLTGSMAIEFDFDPEDDIVNQGNTSLNFQYLTRAVLCGSVNYGSVTARKNCAGGAVGLMGLGLLTDCVSYGSVESTRGEYVGGIAGASYATIRNSWAKCTLSGEKWVGGIAGFGTDISGCRSLVTISGGMSYLGAIAGEADGTLVQNYFVSGELGGVDGISYSGQAQPMEYDQLLQLQGLPDEFKSFFVTFVAQGQTVEVRSVPYGTQLSQIQLPQIPEREGFYGHWETAEQGQLQFDAVIEAVYTPWLTAISSGDGTILAEGEFIPGSSLVKEESQYDPPALAGRETLVGQWRIETEAGQNFTALRIALPKDSGKAAVWRYTQQGTWEKLPYTKEGSYLRTELTGESAVICLTEGPQSRTIWLVLLGCAGAAVICVLAKRIRKRRGNPPERAAKE